ERGPVHGHLAAVHPVGLPDPPRRRVLGGVGATVTVNIERLRDRRDHEPKPRRVRAVDELVVLGSRLPGRVRLVVLPPPPPVDTVKPELLATEGRQQLVDDQRARLIRRQRHRYQTLPVRTLFGLSL